MTLHLTARRFFYILLAIWLLAGCSEPVTDNDDEPRAAPQVEILDGPQARTNEADAVFSFQCLDERSCSFFCRLDDGPSEPCESPITFEGLDDGEYVFEVFAVDDYDQESEAQQWLWTIDTEAPQVVDFTGPADLTNETSATFEFDCSKEDCQFSCSLSSQAGGTLEAATNCTTGKTYTELADDDYTFFVVATDAAGNLSTPETYTWTVDTEAPVIHVLDAPPPETTDDWAAFEFECINKPTCSFECALDYEDESGVVDQGDWENCTSPHLVDELEAGQYTLYLRATDAAGNQATESLAWTVVPIQWAAVSSGARHTCATRNDGSLWCWGRNDSGELGLGDTSDRSTPHQVGDDNDWASVSAGGAYTCAIRDDHTLWCWGQNNHGQLGLGDDNDRNIPHQVDVGIDWNHVSTIRSHACATGDDGSLWCWGRGSAGMLGLGDTSNRNTPHQVGDDNDWNALAPGGFHSCATGEDDSLWCWGNNSYGQLGLGHQTNRNTPHQVGDRTDWDHVSAGTNHTCATSDDDSLWCWGWSNAGQLGLGEISHRITPHQVDDDIDWVTVSAGFDHSCGIGDVDSLWCWGSNSDGQLGLGDTSNRNTPHQVSGDEQWTDLAAGADHTCAITEDRTLWCWGYNYYGQLGIGDETDRTTPHQVEIDTD